MSAVLSCDRRSALERAFSDAVWAYDFQRREGDGLDADTVEYATGECGAELEFVRDGRVGEIADDDLWGAYTVMMMALEWPIEQF